MSFNIKEENGFRYIDEGHGDILLLLHGLFGALSNWESVVNHFGVDHRIVMPLLPIYEMPIREADLEGLVAHVKEFVEFKRLENLTLMGNSLGGHIALIYTLQNPESVDRLVLTGSSGLFENAMGGSYPKRGSYEYVKERVEYTFHNPKTVTKEFVDDIFETCKSIPKCMRIISIAKSAQRHNLAKELPGIKVLTLLIWGLNDTITPPMVAHEFHKLIPNSQLRFIDACCHVPMMEHPAKFNKILEDFLNQTEHVLSKGVN